MRIPKTFKVEVVQLGVVRRRREREEVSLPALQFLVRDQKETYTM
jgi:hypothetical protein